MAAPALLEARDLVVGPSDGGAPILNGLSLSLHSKEILGIYAESGAGKTVLSRALANWLPSSLAYRGGSISFLGNSILGGRNGTGFLVGRDIAYIGSKPQSALDPTLPVGPQLVEKLRCVRSDWSVRECRERVLHLLSEVRIPSPEERFYEHPAKYSGGMMQRAMIVDALCAEPALIIADNITQPLDVTIAEQIVRLLRDLCENHKTAVVFLAASLSTLATLGQRIGILHGGRLVEEEAAERLLARPATPYTRRVISEVPRLWNAAEVPVSRARGDDAPLLQVRDVHRTYAVRKRGHFNAYNQVQAVRGVSFDIMPRENFGIVGESGCGKSTLTRLLAWLEAPDRGEIWLDGESLATLPAERRKQKRREFQLLLQDPYNSLPPRTTIGRIIAEGLLIQGDTKRSELRERVSAAMREVGLSPDLHDALPTALSTGQRQRISIARALALRPKLLILDETLSALDQTEQAKLLELFAQLQETNDLTYVFISHDLAMVRKVCTRVAVMYLGEIVEIADNHSLFFNPAHPYTKALLSAAPTLEERPYASADYLLEGEPPSPINIAPGCSFASRCPARFEPCLSRSPKSAALAPGRAVACHLVERDRAGIAGQGTMAQSSA